MGALKLSILGHIVPQSLSTPSLIGQQLHNKRRI
jgi:hypothetical protein